MVSIITIRNKLIDFMHSSDGITYDYEAIAGIERFGNTYSSKSLSFEFQHQNYSGFTSHDVTNEIDAGYPVVIVFNSVIAGGDIPHANMVYGYESRNGIIRVHTYDPLSNGDRFILWNLTNVYGYFILYVG